jgi:hypothetical protein
VVEEDVVVPVDAVAVVPETVAGSGDPSVGEAKSPGGSSFC